MNKPSEKDAFGDMGNVFGTGVESLFSTPGAQLSQVYIDEIIVKPQIREVFEDEDHTLAEFADSIRNFGILQPILLRRTDAGYVLVAGERRFMASKLAGLEKIPAYIRDMTDQEAEDAQFAENIHRKNLTQMEAAKKLQRDVERLGSVQAVLELHSKSGGWVSKVLGLLDLPTHAKRLVTQNISADVELINTVKTIERLDKEAASRLVDDLRQVRGTKDARDMALAVRNQVKPKKTAKAKSAEPAISMPWDVPAVEAGADAHGVTGDPPLPAVETLRGAYHDIVGRGITPKTFLRKVPQQERDNAEEWLRGFHSKGRQSLALNNHGAELIRGFACGQYSTEGEGVFAFLAFVRGISGSPVADINLLDLLEDCRAGKKAPD
ncbi:MAG: ParB/RepB/Spo0J family partition protein [Candidatus Methylumidiphilus sp.]